MRINPVNNFKYHSFCPKFSGNVDYKKNNYNSIKPWQVLDITGETVLNRHTSYYFRNDLNWIEFGEYLKQKFEGCNKVNSYIWGCAGGQEAYSLSILLDKIFSKSKSKFFPIEAMDIDINIIAKNLSSQENNVLIDDINYFRIINGLKLRPYEVWKYVESKGEFSKLDDEIVSSVNFSCSNIVTGLNRINDTYPSIVMCRNMWPYINPKTYDDCAKEMYKNLKKGSIVVIGDYDIDGEPFLEDSDTFQDSLIKAGFKQKNVAQGKCQSFRSWKKPCYIYEK